MMVSGLGKPGVGLMLKVAGLRSSGPEFESLLGHWNNTGVGCACVCVYLCTYAFTASFGLEDFHGALPL